MVFLEKSKVRMPLLYLVVLAISRCPEKPATQIFFLTRETVLKSINLYSIWSIFASLMFFMLIAACFCKSGAVLANKTLYVNTLSQLKPSKKNTVFVFSEVVKTKIQQQKN